MIIDDSTKQDILKYWIFSHRGRSLYIKAFIVSPIEQTRYYQNK